MKPKAFCAAVLLLILSTTGCVANMDYHVHQPVEYVYGEQTKLVHVELDDFGDFWDMSGNELSQALAAIDEVNSVSQGAVVITFVHGWRNNSNPSNHNLQNFKNILGWIARAELERGDGSPRPVVGVFISWRGKQTLLPAVDYYKRNAAAARVAGSAATEALVAVTNRARQNDRTRSIVIGHSMGALIVERALAPAIEAFVVNAGNEGINIRKELNACAALTDPRQQQRCRCRAGAGWRTRLPVDLALLVNAASYAMEAKKLISMFDRWEFNLQPPPECVAAAAPYFSNNTPWAAPIVVALTSESDFSTRNILRGAAYAKTLNKSFRDYSSTSESGATVTAPFTQRQLVTRSAGNFRPFYSHYGRHVDLDKEKEDDGSERVTPCGSTDAFGRWTEDLAPRRPDWRFRETPQESICFETEHDRFWILRNRDEDSINDTPYWVLPIPSSVVAGHGRIFTWQLFRMIQGIVQVTNAIAPLPSCDETGSPRCDMRQAIATSTTPQRCFAPPAGVGFTYRGTQSGCAPGTGACWPGEEVLFTATVDGRTYEEQACEDLVWDFGDGSPLQEGQTVSHVFSASTEVSLAARSYLGRSNSEPAVVDVAPAEPLAVTYSGASSGCRPGMPCWVGEIVTFRPEQEDVNEVEWEFAGAEKRKERTVPYTFSRPGRSRVRAAGVLPRGRGAADVEVDVIEPDCSVDVGALSIGFTGESSGCTPERGPCKVGEPIVFTLRSATGVIPGCYRLLWSFDRGAESSSNTATFKSDGEHLVRVRVITPSPERLVETRVMTACAPPAKIVVGFRGMVSGCTRERLCAGGSCRTGEMIEFFPHEELSATPQACDQFRWDFGDGRTAQGPDPTHHYDDDAPRVISVTAYSTGGEQTDRFTIRFEPQKPDTDDPPVTHEPPITRRPKPPSRELPASTSKPCTIDLGPGLKTWHIVKAGECLSTIAESYYGRQIWPRLYRANCDIVENPDLIYPKERLRIPKAGSDGPRVRMNKR